VTGGVESVCVSWRWVADGGDEERAAKHELGNLSSYRAVASDVRSMM